MENELAKEARMKRSSKGFSLIELLIVVAIILIIAAIAIPNLLRSRIAANQASAVGSLRTLNTSLITYASTYNVGYASMLNYLGPSTGTVPTSTAAGLVDSVLAGLGGNTSSKSGYNFTYAPSTDTNTGKVITYTLHANPQSTSTGTNYYFTDESGVIRQSTTGTASASDSPIGG
jgi:type IV pilus assembly protein PilA